MSKRINTKLATALRSISKLQERQIILAQCPVAESPKRIFVVSGAPTH